MTKPATHPTLKTTQLPGGVTLTRTGSRTSGSIALEKQTDRWGRVAIELTGCRLLWTRRRLSRNTLIIGPIGIWLNAPVF